MFWLQFMERVLKATKHTFRSQLKEKRKLLTKSDGMQVRYHLKHTMQLVKNQNEIYKNSRLSHKRQGNPIRLDSNKEKKRNMRKCLKNSAGYWNYRFKLVVESDILRQ